MSARAPATPMVLGGVEIEQIKGWYSFGILRINSSPNDVLIVAPAPLLKIPYPQANLRHKLFFYFLLIFYLS